MKQREKENRTLRSVAVVLVMVVFFTLVGVAQKVVRAQVAMICLRGGKCQRQTRAFTPTTASTMWKLSALLTYNVWAAGGWGDK